MMHTILLKNVILHIDLFHDVYMCESVKLSGQTVTIKWWEVSQFMSSGFVKSASFTHSQWINEPRETAQQPETLRLHLNKQVLCQAVVTLLAATRWRNWTVAFVAKRKSNLFWTGLGAAAGVVTSSSKSRRSFHTEDVNVPYFIWIIQTVNTQRHHLTEHKFCEGSKCIF